MKTRLLSSELAAFGGATIVSLAVAGCTAQTAAEEDETIVRTEQPWFAQDIPFLASNDHQWMTFAGALWANSVAPQFGLNEPFNCVAPGAGSLVQGNLMTDDTGGAGADYFRFLYPSRPDSQNHSFLRDGAERAQTACRAAIDDIMTATAWGKQWFWSGFGNAGNIAFGIATHTLQDSFAPAHAQRTQSTVSDVCSVHGLVTTALGRACRHSLPDFTGDDADDNPTQADWAATATGEYLIAVMSELTGRDERATRKVVNKWVKCDLLGRKKNSLVWTHPSNAMSVWQMSRDGKSIANAAFSNWTHSPIASSSHKEYVGDFNGDGYTDVIHLDSPGWSRMTMSISGSGGGVHELTVAGKDPAYLNGWFPRIIADFDGDGRDDILFQSDRGTVVIWFMNGAATREERTIGTGILPGDWLPADAADFDGDGTADILWRNSGGYWSIWYANGPSVAGFNSSQLGWMDPSWRVLAGGFGGAGPRQLLWWKTTGEYQIWWLNYPEQNQLPRAASVDSGNVGAAWRPLHIGDFNGDARQDILWWNAGASQYSIWLAVPNAVGTAYWANGAMFAHPTGWQLAGLGSEQSLNETIQWLPGEFIL